MADGNYDEAIEEFSTHANSLGWDSDVLELVSDCFFRIGDMKNAKEAALLGLKDNARAYLCAASLAASSSMSEIITVVPEKFANTHEPEFAYEAALDYLLELEEFEKALMLFKSFKAHHGGSDLLEYYQESFKDFKQ